MKTFPLSLSHIILAFLLLFAKYNWRRYLCLLCSSHCVGALAAYVMKPSRKHLLLSTLYGWSNRYRTRGLFPDCKNNSGRFLWGSGTSSLQPWIFFTKFKVLDMNFSCGTGPNVNQNLVGYPCNRHATILPAGIAFLVGWFISCKTVDFLP